MIRRYNRISFLFGVPGLILQIVGSVMAQNPAAPDVGRLVITAGCILLILGLGYYAKAKGRAIAWGLMGFLSVIGLIVLASLTDKTLAQGGQEIVEVDPIPTGNPR